MLALIFGDSSDSEGEGPQQTIPKKRCRLDQNGPGEGLEWRLSKMPRLLPIYRNGDVIGYTEAPSSSEFPRNHVAVNPLSVQPGNSTNSGTTGGQPTSGPTEKPSPLFHDFSKWAPLDLSTPAPLSSFTPLNPQPMAEFQNNCDSGMISTSLENLTAGWDVGNDSSTTKYCYINGDAHTHSHLPHAIHFSKQEEEKFHSLVNRHPSLGPAALVVGPKTLDGFGPGAADIAQAARNPDFVAYQCQKVKSQLNTTNITLKLFLKVLQRLQTLKLGQHSQALLTIFIYVFNLVGHGLSQTFLVQPPMEDCPPSEAHEELEKFILDQAWIRLDKYTGESLDGSVKIEPVDVDMEAMVILDWAMFDRSEKAGNMQWGLDTGMHEDGWNPYIPPGPEIEDQLREGNESETQVGPDYNIELENTWKGQQRNHSTRPVPCAVSKKTARSSGTHSTS
ncbi:hypothetical protein GYMLUDRAFT_241299 [Collybiopsis luxurians FD-317 M1]|uniref:Uncharacterized protein n=1 Tax=Collybiopsis luxurians FD-317 M1 TaxID=944289 RepID=A0A0D0C7E5_9AGAR|nr:hypothetical protein GYMLUDRAFT_241299 [Collybiopsis luxurians FD-317 M1]